MSTDIEHDGPIASSVGRFFENGTRMLRGNFTVFLDQWDFSTINVALLTEGLKKMLNLSK